MPTKVRVCVVCDKPFLATRADARFCSARCRNHSIRLRRQQERYSLRNLDPRNADQLGVIEAISPDAGRAVDYVAASYGVGAAALVIEAIHETVLRALDRERQGAARVATAMDVAEDDTPW